MSERLTKSDWIERGLRTLAGHGAGALKVGPMSAGLKVSRGSFYWHFRDIGDFRAQLLQGWQAAATDQIIRETAEKAEPDRLRFLLKRTFAADNRLERAIRAWATEDGEVAAAVALVDARRLAYIAALLTDAGVDGERARHRAAFLYWAYLGRALVMDAGHSAFGDQAMDDICELLEG